MPIAADGDIGPMHHEDSCPNCAPIRAQMGRLRRRPKSVAVETIGASVYAREIAEALALLDTYRAQIEQCEKLKVRTRT